MSRVLAIVNPASANRSTGRFWRDARLSFKKLGLEIEEVLTEAPGHATELAARLGPDGYEVIMYVGGDGTANEVVNGLLTIPQDRRPPLAALPRGTGADFARGLGLAKGAEAAARRLINPSERRLDLALSSFTGPAGNVVQRYFVNIGDAGLGGYVAERANGRSKALGGFASFLRAILSSFWTYEKRLMRVRVDGEIRHEGAATSVIVANGPYFGGGMRIAPDALPDDGLLNVVVIGSVSKLDLIANLHRLYKGTHLTHPRVSSFSGKEVIVEGPEIIPLQMDGEQPGVGPWLVRVAPGVLRVLV